MHAGRQLDAGERVVLDAGRRHRSRRVPAIQVRLRLFLNHLIDTRRQIAEQVRSVAAGNLLALDRRAVQSSAGQPHGDAGDRSLARVHKAVVVQIDVHETRQTGQQGVDDRRLQGLVVHQSRLRLGARHRGPVGHRAREAGIDLGDDRDRSAGAYRQVAQRGGDHALRVRHGSLAGGGRHELDLRRQEILDVDRGRAGRPGVRNSQGVGQLAAGGDRIGRIGLGNPQVDPRLDHRRFRVRVVLRLRIGFRARDAGGVDDVSAGRGIDGHHNGHRGASTAGKIPQGGSDRSVGIDRGALAGGGRDKGDAAGQLVRDRYAGRVGGAVVDDRQGIGQRLSGDHRIGRIGLEDHQINLRLDRGRYAGRVVGGVGLLLVPADRRRVGQGAARRRGDGDDDRDGFGLVDCQVADVHSHGAGGVVGRALRRRGRNERDVRRQRIDDRDAGGRRRAEIGDQQRVGQVFAGHDGVRRIGLDDLQVDPRLDLGRLAARVVVGFGIGFVPGHTGRIDDLALQRARDGRGQGDRGRTSLGKIAQVGSDRAIGRRDGSLRRRAGNKAQARRQHVGHGHAGGLRRPVVGDQQRVGQRFPGSHRVGRIRLDDSQIDFGQHGRRHRIGVVFQIAFVLVGDDRSRVDDRLARCRIDVDRDRRGRRLSDSQVAQVDRDHVAANAGRAGAAGGNELNAGGQRVCDGHFGSIRWPVVPDQQGVHQLLAGHDGIRRVTLGEHQIDLGGDRGLGGVRIVGQVGFLFVRGNLRFVEQYAAHRRSHIDRQGDGRRGAGRQIAQAGGDRAAHVRDGALAGCRGDERHTLRQRIDHRDTRGVGRSVIAHQQRVNQRLPRGHRVGRVALGDAQIHELLHIGRLVVRVVLRHRVDGVRGHLGGIQQAIGQRGIDRDHHGDRRRFCHIQIAHVRRDDPGRVAGRALGGADALEGDSRGKRVGEYHARGGRRAVVGDDQRVRERVAGGDRIGIVGLDHLQIGQRGEAEIERQIGVGILLRAIAGPAGAERNR